MTASLYIALFVNGLPTLLQKALLGQFLINEWNLFSAVRLDSQCHLSAASIALAGTGTVLFLLSLLREYRYRMRRSLQQEPQPNSCTGVESSLASSEERFQTSVEIMLDCFGVYSAMRNATGQIVDFRVDYVNNAACVSNQLTREAQVGRGLCELLPGHRTSGLLEEYIQVVETGQPLIKEAVLYEDQYGEQQLIRAFDIRATKLGDGFVATWRDVTERKRIEDEWKQTEEALRRSEAVAKARTKELEIFMETVPVAVWIAHDPECHHVTANRAAYDLMRKPAGSVLTATPADGQYPFTFRIQQNGQDVPYDQLPMQRAGQTGEATTGEYEFVFSPTDVQLISGRAVPLWDEAGQIRGVIGAFWDLTERKQMETVLHQSEERLRCLVSSSIIGIIEANPEHITFANDAFLQMLGYTQTDVQTGQLSWRSMTPPEYDAIDQLKVAEVYESGACVPFEKEYIHKDGSRVPILLGGALLTREPFTWVCFILDLTQSKQTEAALRESEERLSLALDAARIGSWDWNLQTDEVFWTPYHAMLLDYEPASPKRTYEEWMKRVHPEDLPLVQSAVHAAMIDKHNYAADYRVIWQDGSIHWLSSFGRFRYDAEGKPIRMLGMLFDITARKQTEAALRESQERLNLALEAANMGSWDWNIATGEVHWSTNLERMFGLAAGEFDGRYETVIAMIHPDDREWVLQSIQRAVFEREDYNIEFRFIKPDGNMRWAIGRGRVFYDQSGHPVRMTGVDLDITDRKVAEEALRQSELKFRLLADTMPQIVWSGQADGLIDYYNQRWYEYTEMTLEQSQGSGWIAVLHPEDTQRCLELWQESLRTGNLYQIEYRLRRAADGEYRWHLGRALPLRDEAGKILKWFGSCIDIHDQKLVIEERAQALERERTARIELERASRMKDEFLAIVSHELRSPLNGILGWARLLRTRNLAANITEQALASIERNAQAQTQLIEDLLDISRIIRGTIRLNLQPTLLIPIIQAALDTVRPTANTKLIHIDTHFNPAAELVSGDADRLQQIVWNLLSNAVKFTPEGGQVGIQLELVDIRLEEEEKESPSHSTCYAQITVIDTGKGIKPDFLPYVFDRFRQADSTTTRIQGGLGLGLAIVRNLAELHGGSVWVKSPGEGLGTTFGVRLPLLRSPVVEPQDNELTPQRQTTWQTGFDLTGLKILVVDDEADAREFLKTALEQFGATVATAASAREALERLLLFQPDILLSDIGMPAEDGYSLMRQIRSLPAEQGGQIPAAALTAYAREGDRLQALEAGFQTHIPKPIEPLQLLTVLTKLAKTR